MQHTSKIHLLPRTARRRLGLRIRCRRPVLLPLSLSPLLLLHRSMLLLLLLTVHLILIPPGLLHLPLLRPLTSYSPCPCSGLTYSSSLVLIRLGMGVELGAARRWVAVVGCCLAIHLGMSRLTVVGIVI